MATPRARGVMSLTISSLIRTSPDVCRSRPAMILRKVVLPQPDGPSSTRNSPSRTDRLMPSTAGRLQLPLPIAINVPRGEQLSPPAPQFASVHAADHFL